MKIYLGYGHASWTTAAYWERALRRLGEVVYVGTPKESPPSVFQEVDLLSLVQGYSNDDVFLYVDSGIKYFPRNIEKAPLLTACYMIDVHVDFAMRLEMAKFFDIVFVAQKDYVPRFLSAGIKDVRWVPFGCDPDIYRPQRLESAYDVAFVGHVHQDNVRRRRLLSLLAGRYRMNDTSRFYSPEETSRVYGSAKIVFNCAAYGDLNMRVFEAMSCGRMLLTDRIENGFPDLFEDRKHLVVYRSEEELLELADHYLRHEEERERIASAGRDLVHSRHAYVHRVASVADIFAGQGGGRRTSRAFWRNAGPGPVSLSMARIYFRWRLLDLLFKECRKSSGILDFLEKSLLSALGLLLGLKQRWSKGLKK